MEFQSPADSSDFPRWDQDQVVTGACWPGAADANHPPLFTALWLSGVLVETQILIEKADTGGMKLRSSLELRLWSYHRLCYSYLPLLNLPSELQEVIHGIKIFPQPWVLRIRTKIVYSKLQNSLFLHCSANIYPIPCMSTNFSLSRSSNHPKGLNTHKSDQYRDSFVKRL